MRLRNSHNEVLLVSISRLEPIRETMNKERVFWYMYALSVSLWEQSSKFGRVEQGKSLTWPLSASIQLFFFSLSQGKQKKSGLQD